jgi:hypothetical protein
MAALVLALLACVVNSAGAAVIQSHNVGGTGGGNTNDPGLSLVTPPGGPWTNITFNWYRTGTGASYAIGNLYLLSQNYTGTPQDLSSLTTGGYIAHATGDGTVYTFASGITLQANTTYYFFADLGLSTGASTEVGRGPGTDLATVQSYGATAGNSAFATRSFDISYSLNGTSPSVPEPTATGPAVGFTLLLCAAIGAGCRRRAAAAGKLGYRCFR